MKKITFLLLGILIQLINPTLALAEFLPSLHSAGLMKAQGPQGKKILIPLKKTKANLEITGSLMRVQVNQEFKNKNKFPLEAVYVFPLPATATVTDYQIIYQDKVIKSVVQEKHEAKFTYEQAKSQGKRAALLEQERPNLFTTSVANILPGETVNVVITFLTPLNYHNATYEILFPTVVGPRYIPIRYGLDVHDNLIARPPAMDADRITPPLVPEGMDPNYELEIQASIDGIPYQSISSPTHAIKVKKKQAQSALVRLRKKAIPNSDFVLKISIAQADQPTLSVIQHHDAQHTYGLLNIFPPLEKNNRPPVSREVLFLIDTSGSMEGTSIQQAKEGLKKCLYGLRGQDFFNIVRFSDDFSAMASQALPATKENLGKALDYMEQLYAGGGTEMQPALEYVLNLPPQHGTMRMVVFLTDGDVGNEASLMGLLKNQLNGARVFPFGIGSAPNEYLLRKMSELGHGVVHFIHDQQEIDQVMGDFFKTIDSPVLTDVKVTWQNASGRPMKNVQLFPKQLPDVYQDRPLSLYYQSPPFETGTLQVEGKINQQKVLLSYTLPPARQNHAGIKTLFGKAEIDELLYQYQFNPSMDPQKTKRAIIAKALDYQLVTQFTSRVAVEEKIVRRQGDQLITAKVPTLLPKGWSYGGLTATATQDSLYLMLGTLLVLLATLCWYFSKRSQAHEEI